MRIPLFSAAILCLIAIAPASQAEPQFQLRWTASLDTLLESSPTLADLNNDGLDEILVAGREELIALDGNGKELWRWRTPGRFMTYPAVLKREGDLPPLVYVADTAGAFSCIDGNGKLEWQAKLKAGSSWSAATVYDLNNDGNPEVVQTDESGAVWAFDALTGKVVWQSAVKGIPVSPAISRRSANDPTPIIVIATGTGMLTALDGNGAILWENQIGGASQSWATAAPVIFGNSKGDAQIITATSDGAIASLDVKGGMFWRRPMQGAIASTNSAGDIDLDGAPDIFCITQNGVIYRLSEDGEQLLWKIDMQGRSLAAGAILDVDGDGRMEYLLSTQSGRFMVFNDQGRPTFLHTFDNRTINVTPTFGKVAKSSPTLDMVITGGESGRVFCFSTEAPRKTIRQWWQYRGPSRSNSCWLDLAKTALPKAEKLGEVNPPLRTQETPPAHITPVNLDGSHLMPGEPAVFRIESANPIDEPLEAMVLCECPGGVLRAALSPVVSQHTEISFAMDFPGSGQYHFEWMLRNRKGTILDAGNREIPIEPYENVDGFIRKCIDNVGQAIEYGPLDRALNRELVELLARYDHFTQPQQETPIFPDPWTTTELLTRARQDARIAEAVRNTKWIGSSGSVLAFEDVTWESRNVSERVPRQAENPLNITRRVVPNEHEPVSLNMLNITGRELQVRALVESPTPGPVVVLHYSQSAPTGHGTMAWDPLPECDESSVLSIPSLSSRELWLDVQVGPAAPGEHHIKVRLLALNGAGVIESGANPHDVAPPETVVDIALNVLPFEMAPASAMRLCAWASLNPAAVADMLAHGNNVFCAPPPELRFDDQKRLSGCDYAKLDAVLTLLRGNDVVVLVQGLPALQAAHDTPEYKANLKRYLDDLVQHLADAGFDARHFALYPIDEPGGAGWNAVNQLVAFGKAVHEARPDVQVYMDGGGELPMFEAMASCIDIWCPAIVMLADDSPEMRVVRATNKPLWSYDCGYGYATATRASLKDTNVVADYRNAALFAVRHGGEGIGFWSYNIGTDPWGRVELDYPLVYPGRTKPVTSRRWEAVREGIEDARIAIALRERAASLSDEQAKAAIKDLLENALPAMLDPSFKEMKLGLGRHAIDLSNSDATVNAFRGKMLDCVERVCGKN